MQNARWRVKQLARQMKWTMKKRTKNPREKVAERTQRPHKSQRGFACLLPATRGGRMIHIMDEQKLILYALYPSSPENRCLGGRTLQRSRPDVRLRCQHLTCQEKPIQGTSQDVQARIREVQGRGVYYVFSAATCSGHLLFGAWAGDD